MKYWIIGIIVVGLVVGGFLAGTKHGENRAEETVTPNPTAILSPSVSLLPIQGSSEGSIIVGNRPGNRAPDFRLKDSQGNDVSLRDYLNREEVRLEFVVSGQVMLNGRTLLDPTETVRKLYAVTSMPYTVVIDINGIIK